MAGQPATTGHAWRDADDGHPGGDGCHGRAHRWRLRVRGVGDHFAASAANGGWYRPLRSGDADASADRALAERRAHGEPGFGRPDGTGAHCCARDRPTGRHELAARHRRAVAAADRVAHADAGRNAGAHGIQRPIGVAVTDAVGDRLAGGDAGSHRNAGAHGDAGSDADAGTDGNPQRHGNPVGDPDAEPVGIPRAVTGWIGNAQASADASAVAVAHGSADHNANAVSGGGADLIALGIGRAGRATERQGTQPRHQEV